jgi:hypothetical protein
LGEIPGDFARGQTVHCHFFHRDADFAQLRGQPISRRAKGRDMVAALPQQVTENDDVPFHAAGARRRDDLENIHAAGRSTRRIKPTLAAGRMYAFLSPDAPLHLRAERKTLSRRMEARLFDLTRIRMPNRKTNT